MTASAVPIVSAHAEESTELYPYMLFAASNDTGAIPMFESKKNRKLKNNDATTYHHSIEDDLLNG